MMQFSLSLRGDTATPPGPVRTAGDRLATPSAKPIAGFSTKRDLYNRWRRCRARYRKAQRSHHGQRAAWVAFRDAMISRLTAELN